MLVKYGFHRDRGKKFIVFLQFLDFRTISFREEKFLAANYDKIKCSLIEEGLVKSVQLKKDIRNGLQMP